MKSLCIVLAWLGQFEVQEIVTQTHLNSIFVVEELKPVPVQTPVDDRPVFDLLGASWCGGCVSVNDTLASLDPDKLPFRYRYVNVDTHGWQSATSIPAFVYNGRVIQYGWSSSAGLMNNFRKATQPQRAIQRLSSSQLKQFAQSYRGPTVRIKGMTAWQHLQDSNHGFTANQLAGLTEYECFKIHGAHHYNYLTPYRIGN